MSLNEFHQGVAVDYKNYLQTKHVIQPVHREPAFSGAKKLLSEAAQTSTDEYSSAVQVSSDFSSPLLASLAQHTSGLKDLVKLLTDAIEKESKTLAVLQETADNLPTQDQIDRLSRLLEEERSHARVSDEVLDDIRTKVEALCMRAVTTGGIRPRWVEG
ncbi:hypothetical protein J8273_4204 [Carpediemonas membranifera]|uniref:Uncharacterized protein n=1 Tax=Carpediemonas membranifera TaxID=201153 RepID=A0A8J6AYF9_9EUKA|nr:hypothetical protein J8273_4204 [Carpediemonas membranifera]|eukprot:KAG9394530.1 hypothetical protein J8273_4204 [Carpediemonas membranifera]